MKTEPDVYSVSDLEKDGTTCWEGVRNYQARNNMVKMRLGDSVLFYHSNAKPPGVAGIATVVKEVYPDHFARDSKSKYFDPKATAENPRWQMVDLGFMAKFDETVGLDRIKATTALAAMVLVNNSRLSVQPVRKSEFDLIKKMSGRR